MLMRQGDFSWAAIKKALPRTEKPLLVFYVECLMKGSDTDS